MLAPVWEVTYTENEILDFRQSSNTEADSVKTSLEMTQDIQKHVVTFSQRLSILEPLQLLAIFLMEETDRLWQQKVG